MHIHILGICGTFMGGIAAIAKQAGHRVSGCDANVYPPMSTQLEGLGIALTQGWDAGQLETVAKGADVFVVGNALSRGNPLVEAILDGGYAYTSGPQWLYENVLQDKWVLAVAGTHGKTTTTSILAWILEHAGLAPGFLIGGIPANFNLSARLSGSASPFFVIEADEYDTAFFDKRSKFVHYRPRTAVLNNLEYDHADIFPDLAAIETQFHHLVRSVPAQGRLVVNREASLDRVLARGCWSEVERFADGSDGWRIDDAGNVSLGDDAQGRLEWSLWGRHNRLNALAAIAAARHAGVPVRESLAALREFRGIRRRLETRGEAGGVTVYDDFAHHPTAIRETIAALRQHIGAARLVAVLEPRSNTMKLGTMKQQLPASLEDADAIFCYGHNLGWDPREALAPLGARAQVHGDLDELVSAVAQSARPRDHVLVMSNGGFGGVHEKLLRALSGGAA
jgi:UDP-N-acetylmuramate: L-alanyl-gamma-D-glutamyl-meso-diaminopimelate ligase